MTSTVPIIRSPYPCRDCGEWPHEAGKILHVPGCSFEGRHIVASLGVDDRPRPGRQRHRSV